MKTSFSPCCFLDLLAGSRKFCSGFTLSIKRKRSRGRRPRWRTVILTLALTEVRWSMTWCCSRWGRTEEANWQIKNVGCLCSLQLSEVHFCCCLLLTSISSSRSFVLRPLQSVSQSIKPPSSTDTGHQGTDRQREGWGAFLRWSAHLHLTNWTSSQTRCISHSESSVFIISPSPGLLLSHTDSLQYFHHSERGHLSNYLLVCRQRDRQMLKTKVHR